MHSDEMPTPEERPADLYEKVDAGKRRLLKTALVGAAYTVPLMTSFSMDGLRLGTKAAQAGGILAFGGNQTSPKGGLFEKLRFLLRRFFS